MNTTPSYSFGDLLRRYRVAAGLTQEALAERARLSPRTISDLERGVTNWPYRDTMTLLADALALTLEERDALDATRRRPLASRTADGGTVRRLGDVAGPAVMAPDSPSQLRTFLVAESRIDEHLAPRQDDAGARLAARFTTVAREWVPAYGGRLIELRGSELVVAFGSARQALRAAIDLERRCAEATAAEPRWPLSVGIGLDAGEATPVDGGYHGGALNLAARLCSLAAPGEILASAGVAHLARKTDGVAYVERGDVALDGLTEVARVIQIVPEGVASEHDGRVQEIERPAGPTQREARMTALYNAARVAAAMENWSAALEQLQQLLTLEPAHQEAATLVGRVRRQQELPELYMKGREHYDAGRWRAALDYFRQVQEVAGNYKGVYALMATAEYEIAHDESLHEQPATPASPRASGHATAALDTHYAQVMKAIVDGRVVPFLGSDINLCGRPANLAWRRGQYLPTHDELAAYLAQAFDYRGSDPAGLARVSQHIALTTGAGPLYTTLRDLYDSDYPPTPAHQLMATLPGILRARGYPARHQLIVTTGFDDVLERAFLAAGEPFDLVTYVAEGEHRGYFVHYPPGAEARLIDRPNEYSELSLTRRTVILKVHGAVDRGHAEQDSYVITEDNYIGYLTRFDISNVIPVALLAKLRTSHLLFLGYSLSDWNQRVVMHRLWGEQKLSDTYRCWAVPADARPIDHEFWNKRDVTTLPVRLSDYIANLSRRVQSLPPVGPDHG